MDTPSGEPAPGDPNSVEQPGPPIRCGSPEGNFSTCQRRGRPSFGTGGRGGFLNSSCIFLSERGIHYGEGTYHNCCCYGCALRETPNFDATVEAHEEFLRHLEREQSIAFLSALPPGSAAVLGPLESQGRGFMHPHGIYASQPSLARSQASRSSSCPARMNMPNGREPRMTVLDGLPNERTPVRMNHLSTA